MVDSVDNKGDNAGQDGKRNADGGDTCSEEHKGTNVPSRAVSTRYLKPRPGDTHLISESRIWCILAR